MKKSILLFALSTTLLGGVYAGYEYLSRGRCNPRGECKKPVETVQDVNIVFTMVEAVVYVEDKL